MGRLAVLPSDVKFLHRTSQQAFKMCLPPEPAFLISYAMQAGVPDSSCSSSVYPGTCPRSVRDHFHCSQRPRSSGLAGVGLTCSERTLELVRHFLSDPDQASESVEGRLYHRGFLGVLGTALHVSSSSQLGV